MDRLFDDTSPDAEEFIIVVIGRTPPCRKMQMIMEMIETTRRLAEAGLRQRYPDAGNTGLRRRLADLVLGPELAHPLVDILKESFYVSLDAARNAIDRRGSFNAIHLQTIFKVDVFVSRRREFDKSRFQRRTLLNLLPGKRKPVQVASAEDVVLPKLEWIRAGNRVAGRQWQGVLGILKVLRGALYLGYLRYWAKELDVAELLERALAQLES